jgi:hypothetical protein
LNDDGRPIGNAAFARGALAGGMSKEHGRERVPPAETEEMINSAIAEAATTFGVPAGSIKAQHP